MSKMKLIALTTLACGSMASLVADQAANKGSTNGNGSTAQSYVITPSAQPVVEGDCDFFVTADFIWWKPNQEGSSVAFTGFSPDGTTNASNGHVLNPHYQFEPGFKLGVGTTMKHDTWDLYLNWTWLRSEDTKSHHNTKSSESVFTDLRFSDTGSNEPRIWAVQEAETRWNMHFNVIDLELGRNFWISKYLTLRPHFGLKTAWIHQNQSTEFEGVADTGIASLTSVAEAEVKMHQHYWGLGIRTGLNTSWHFDRNWSIYGDFALAALWTDYDNSRKDEFETTQGGTELVTYRGKSDLHTIEPVLEIGLGLMYQTWWHNDDYQFTIAAGWEEQVWFNHNQNINISSHRNGNFTLQGLTVKVGFEF
jgi:hypothetical protein